jgi:hypothetical protein
VAYLDAGQRKMEKKRLSCFYIDSPFPQVLFIFLSKTDILRDLLKTEILRGLRHLRYLVISAPKSQGWLWSHF